MKWAAKMKRTGVCFSTIVFLLIGCTPNQNIPQYDANLTAIGNMRNRGQIVSSDGDIYFVDDEGHIKPGIADDSDCLVENAWECYCSYDGWIYYSDLHNLYRVNTHNKAVMQLANFVCRELIVVNGKLYFTIPSEEMQGIYSMNPDGTELTQLYEDFATSLCSSNEYLYFANGGTVYRLDFTNNSVSALSLSKKVTEFFIMDNVLYFTEGNLRLYTTTLNSDEICKPILTDASEIVTTNICKDGWVIAAYDKNVKPRLYIYRFDSQTLKKISNQVSSQIYVSEDLIFLSSFDQPPFICLTTAGETVGQG